MSSDQWLEEGNCAKCRRSKYCSTQCSANKRHVSAHVARLVNSVCFSAMKDMAKAKHRMRKENEARGNNS